MRDSGRHETSCAERGVATYLLFGSNLGDRRAAVEAALSYIGGRGVRWERRSSFYETEPVGVEEQPWFLNLVALGRTCLAPRAVLTLCKEAEARAGRTAGPRFGPRTLDVDILLYGNVELGEPDLVIPHPRLRERRFALTPLVEIAPDLVDFRDGERFAAILQRLGEGKKVSKSTTRES